MKSRQLDQLSIGVNRLWWPSMLVSVSGLSGSI
jgi:hypothetical protein